MKPHIKKDSGSWICEGAGVLSFGPTPWQAYCMWHVWGQS